MNLVISIPDMILSISCPLSPLTGYSTIMPSTLPRLSTLFVILWPYLYPNCVHDIIPISSVPFFNHDLLSFPLIPSSTLNSSSIGNDNFGAYYCSLSTSRVSFSFLPSLDSAVHCYITLYIILYSWPARSQSYTPGKPQLWWSLSLPTLPMPVLAQQNRLEENKRPCWLVSLEINAQSLKAGPLSCPTIPLQFSSPCVLSFPRN